MILYVQEFNDDNSYTVSQQLKITKDCEIVAVRPKIYKQNQPNGVLKVEFKSPDGELLATSYGVEITSFAVLNYFHGYIRFDINYSAKEGDIINVVLTATGNIFNQVSFVGICNDWELQKYQRNYESQNWSEDALDIEIITKDNSF